MDRAERHNRLRDDLARCAEAMGYRTRTEVRSRGCRADLIIDTDDAEPVAVVEIKTRFDASNYATTCGQIRRYIEEFDGRYSLVLAAPAIDPDVKWWHGDWRAIPIASLKRRLEWYRTQFPRPHSLMPHISIVDRQLLARQAA